MNMLRLGQMGLGLCLVAALGLPLAGCSSMGMGSSAFGSNKVAIAELPDGTTLTSTEALAEGRSHFRNSDFGYSAAYYKKAVELAPNNAEAYFGLGASYDQLGRFDLSDRVYTALLKVSGPSVQYYNNVGYSHMLRGDLKGALMDFHKAEKLDPNNMIVANNMQLLKDAAATAGA